MLSCFAATWWISADCRILAAHLKVRTASVFYSRVRVCRHVFDSSRLGSVLFTNEVVVWMMLRLEQERRRPIPNLKDVKSVLRCVLVFCVSFFLGALNASKADHRRREFPVLSSMWRRMWQSIRFSGLHIRVVVAKSYGNTGREEIILVQTFSSKTHD